MNIDLKEFFSIKNLDIKKISKEAGEATERAQKNAEETLQRIEEQIKNYVSREK